MKRLFLTLSFLATFFLSCKNQESGIARIEGRQIQIVDSIPGNPEIEAFIAPFRNHIAQEMDSVLAYAPNSLDKKNGDLNTAIGNMMADAVMELAGPVFESRTGKTIDIVLLNHGGIRSTINMGDITTRTAYQIMPFENEVVVVELMGEHLLEMVKYLIKAKTAHPVSGMELWINEEDEVEKFLVQEEPVQKNRKYYVATNDYLFQGGDNMAFFSSSTNVTNLDYKIRNLLIDYFKQEDTIAPVTDQRFIRK